MERKGVVRKTVRRDWQTNPSRFRDSSRFVEVALPNVLISLSLTRWLLSKHNHSQTAIFFRSDNRE